MATATKTRPRARRRPKREVPVKTIETPVTAADSVATPPTAITTKVETLYLITNEGLQILIGAEGDWIRDKIKDDTANTPLAYRHYDDDKRVWATWAVLQTDGTVQPISFPDPSEYGITPPELYTKTETFKKIISEIVQILGETKQSVWEKMMKPTTVIMAIVVVVAFAGLVVTTAGG